LFISRGYTSSAPVWGGARTCCGPPSFLMLRTNRRTIGFGAQAPCPRMPTASSLSLPRLGLIGVASRPPFSAASGSHRPSSSAAFFLGSPVHSRVRGRRSAGLDASRFRSPRAFSTGKRSFGVLLPVTCGSSSLSVIFQHHIPCCTWLPAGPSHIKLRSAACPCVVTLWDQLFSSCER